MAQMNSNSNKCYIEVDSCRKKNPSQELIDYIHFVLDRTRTATMMTTTILRTNQLTHAKCCSMLFILEVRIVWRRFNRLLKSNDLIFISGCKRSNIFEYNIRCNYIIYTGNCDLIGHYLKNVDSFQVCCPIEKWKIKILWLQISDKCSFISLLLSVSYQSQTNYNNC